MPDPSIEPVLQVTATAAEPGGVAPMALHGSQRRRLALMIETIKDMSTGVDALGQRPAAA